MIELDFAREGPQLHSPAGHVAAITPDDDTDLVTPARALRVTADGDLVFLPLGNADADWITWAVTAGEILPVRVRRVHTDTTATVHALW